MSAPGPTNQPLPTNSSPASSATDSSKPDLFKKPNFEAVENYINQKTTPDVAEKLLKWTKQLESWVDHAMETVDGHDDKLREQKENFEEAAENAEAQAKHWELKSEFVDGIVDIVADIERGVKDMDDLRTHMETVPE